MSLEVLNKKIVKKDVTLMGPVTEKVIQFGTGVLLRGLPDYFIHKANEKGIFKQTIYYPLQLFAKNVHGTALDVHVDCETYNTERFPIGFGESTTQQKDVPYLDVSATYNNGELIQCVVNRNKDKI